MRSTDLEFLILIYIVLAIITKLTSTTIFQTFQLNYLKPCRAPLQLMVNNNSVGYLLECTPFVFFHSINLRNQEQIADYIIIDNQHSHSYA